MKPIELGTPATAIEIAELLSALRSPEKDVLRRILFQLDQLKEKPMPEHEWHDPQIFKAAPMLKDSSAKISTVEEIKSDLFELMFLFKTASVFLSKQDILHLASRLTLTEKDFEFLKANQEATIDILTKYKK